MLTTIFVNFNFHRFMQSGGYLDFFLKKWIEVFVKNIFIYLSQFFGEKYIIEFLTKKILNNSIFYFNKYLGWLKLYYFIFFLQIISLVFFFLTFLNLLLIIF